jgi:thiol:disulfide interchange protein
MPRANGSTRTTPALLVAVTLVLLVTRVAAGVHEWKHPPKWPDLVRWQTPHDANEGVKGKPVLYDFSARWCEPCGVMQQDVFGDDKSAQLINDEFQPIKVADEDKSAGASALRERFNVHEYPTLIIAGGGLAEPQTEAGYPSKETVEKFMRKSMRKVYEIKLDKE